jgi:pimeloyl-ACP methyl ester carboxylesterase
VSRIGSRTMVRTSGGLLAVLELGDRERPTLLLIHGFPQTSHAWSGLGALLTSRFHVIAPDLIRAGDPEVGPDVDLGVGAQAGYLREALGSMGVDRLAAVGQGIGGEVAQVLASSGPGIEALVLLSSEPVDRPRAGGSASIVDVESLDPAAPLPRGVVGSIFAEGLVRAAISDEDLAEYRRPFERPGGTAAFIRYLTMASGRDAVLPDESLSAIEAPTLILWGEDDPISPVSSAEHLNQAIASSSLGLLPGCGHFLIEEAGPTVIPMIYEYLRARYLLEPHGHAAAVPVELGRELSG